MHIEPFFDPNTFTLTYVVWDQQSRDGLVIDPVLDYDPQAISTSTQSIDTVLAYIERHGVRVHCILETHAHADHLSSSQYLKRKLKAPLAIGESIREVQETFKKIYDLPADFATDGSQFDVLLKDGQTLRAGTLEVRSMATPGHTPACLTYCIGDALFTGDAIFIEDYGVGRCDFPKGSAETLYQSVHEKLYTFADATRVFVGHDYQPHGRALRYETTIGAQKRHNIHLRADTTQDEFVAMRTARDKTLQAPKLLHPSIQVNMNGGKLPSLHNNGLRYIVLPLNLGRDNIGEDGAGR